MGLCSHETLAPPSDSWFISDKCEMEEGSKKKWLCYLLVLGDDWAPVESLLSLGLRLTTVGENIDFANLSS